jgi:Ni,Fe-hydrogenase III small subunit
LKGAFVLIALHGLLAKTAPTVVTGAVGVAAYEALRRAVAKAPLRKASVAATACGLRVVRHAGAKAEQVQLTVGDVIAEARERVGEEVPPAAEAASGHVHDD